MNSIKTLSAALTEWAMVVVKSGMPQLVVPPDSTIGRMMLFMGVNPATYNIYNELGFLLQPTLKTYIDPMLVKFFKDMSDEEVMSVAMAYIDACEQHANEQGHVNLFGIELGANAFAGLRDIIKSK
jgi:hypothetical protein